MNKLFANLRSVLWLAAMALFGAGSVSAETLMMPNRDTLTGTNTVVWGVTTQANGLNYQMNFGDGEVVNGVVADRSYIAFNKVYALAGTYTATLTIGAESATVQIRAFSAADLTPANLRGLNINRAIQDGLRYQWFSQNARAANFPAGTATSWASGHGNNVMTALLVAAFQNHGYRVPNNGDAPTGLYEKYIVQRGLNQVLSGLSTLALSNQPAGNPCVGVAVNPCNGLFSNTAGGYLDYETPVLLAAFATSGAPARTSTVAGVTNGMSYGEITQRISNTVVWSQSEGTTQRGGWRYAFNGGQNDGSTMGWAVLGLLDAAAAGAVVPDFARSETLIGLNGIHNNNGSLDYVADGNPAAFSSPGMEKGGIPLQALFFGGQPAPFPAGSRGEATIKYIYDRWLGGINDSSWFCGTLNASPIANVTTQNFGCAYSMFNIFKGLGLNGIALLRDPTNAAAPAYDWYTQYVDWLVARQNAPTTMTGGQWSAMGFSCCESGQSGKDAIALLILSPVVLVAPDPETFSEIGLQHGNPLTTNPDTNPVNTLHTVVAKVESAGGAPIPGVTISFQVTGRNSTTGSGTSDGAGQVSFSYTDTGPAASNGTDNIRAFIGQVGSNIASNILVKNWQTAAAIVCDVDNNNVVNNADLLAIRAKNGQVAAAGDPFDPNGDGRINVADVRFCQLRLTPSN